MRIFVTGAAAALAANYAYADQRLPVPIHGGEFSYFWNITSINTAHDDKLSVRTFHVATPGRGDGVTILQVHAAIPNSKVERVIIWDLGSGPGSIKSIDVSNYKVTIRGWSATQGPVTCVYHLKLVEGEVSDELDDEGCKR